MYMFAAPRTMLGNPDSGIKEFLLGESRILALESIILLKKTGTPWHLKTKPLTRNQSLSTPGRIVK